ncbi:MAG: hemin uptake protein HemP [Pseudomonadota bacterium]
MNTVAARRLERIAPKPENETVRITSQQLMCGERKIVIVHDDSEYTLQVTRQNKLLLTK